MSAYDSHDGRAFLAAVLANPGDDAPRLVFADWLDEHGSGDDLLRAELIRVQCRLAASSADGCLRHGRCGSDDGDGRLCAGCLPHAEDIARADKIMTASRMIDWVSSGLWKAGLTQPTYTLGISASPAHGCGELMRRGFLEALHLTVDDWCRVAAHVRTTHPVTAVHFTDTPRHVRGIGTDTLEYTFDFAALPVRIMRRSAGLLDAEQCAPRALVTAASRTWRGIVFSAGDDNPVFERHV